MSNTTAIPSWRSAQKNLTAILGSILINLLVLYVVGFFMVMDVAQQPEPAAKEPNEVVVSLEELLPQFLDPEAPTPQTKSYLETYQNQESEQAPENAMFESDRNTLAATETLPTEPGDIPIPTQDGTEEIPGIQLQDHNFVDGPDGEISKSMESTAGAPSSAPAELKPPSPDATMAQTLTEVPPTKTTEEQTENPDPKAKETIEDPSDSTMDEGQPTDMEVAEEEGGAPETMEMAKMDIPKMRDSFSDDFEVVDETMEATPDVEDAMPEKNVEALKERLRPFATSPEAKQNPTMVPTPFMKPQETTVPVPEGTLPSRSTMGEASDAAFSPERHRNKINGSLSNIGRNPAVDAERTPLGQYKRDVSRAIERRWHQLKDQNITSVSFGSLKISFLVNHQGKVKDIRLLHDDANFTVTSFSQQAVMTADIPPMPQEIIDLLGQDDLEVTYDIIIY